MKGLIFTVAALLVFFALPAKALAHHEEVAICHMLEKNTYEYMIVDPDGIHADHLNDVFNVTGPESCVGVVPIAETTKSPTVHPSESSWTPEPVETPPADVYECNDFATQADAQKLYDLYHTEFGDFAQLDPNGNGIACEKDESIIAKPLPSPSNSLEQAELPRTGTSVTQIIVVSLILLSVGLLSVLLPLVLRRLRKS